MAIIHVSAQRGNDAYTKAEVADQATPWATITKAVANVVAGDTVYIGPGTYREKLSLATSGTAGNPISWIPDSVCKYLTSDNPGIVRITGCGVDEVPTSGSVWVFNNKLHNILGDKDAGFVQMFIDGSTGYAVGANDTIYQYCYGLVIRSNYGIQYGGIHENCIMECAFLGQFNGTDTINRNCIFIGGYQIVFNLTYVRPRNINCIVIGGSFAFYQTHNINCMAIGSNVGFQHGTSVNCQAMHAGNSGFYAEGGALANCRAISCNTGFFGSNSANKLDTSTCSQVGCDKAQRGVGTYETHAVATAKQPLYDLSKLVEMFNPFFQQNSPGAGAEGAIRCLGVLAGDTVTINGLVFTAHATTTTPANREFSIVGATNILDAIELANCINDLTYGVPDVTAANSGQSEMISLQTTNPTTFTLTSSNTRLSVSVVANSGSDMMGCNRLIGDGTIDIGPYAQSIVTSDFTNYRTVKPGIQIQRAGMQKFTFFADKNIAFTRSVWVKWSNVAADKKPQLIAKGVHITTQTVTATGDGSVWEQLTITATPAADGEIELFVYAQDTAETAVVYFSDLG